MLEGVVNVLKPPGMTSSDVVTDVRRIFGIKRVGHTGTLDPGAAGVLGICIGRATRLFDLLVDKQKSYIFELTLGAATDTQDSYGKVIARSDMEIDEAALRTLLPRFMGEISQTAPLYSALKVGGKALYAHARAGNAVEPKVRNTFVYGLELLERTGENRFLLRLCCAKGTYVRTLCHDMGLALGGYGYMSFLLRTRAGTLAVEDAYSIPELIALKETGRLAQAVMPPDEAVSFLPAQHLALPERAHRLLLHGASIPTDAADGLMRLYLEDGFIGIGMVEDGMLHMSLSFTQTEA